MSIAKVIVSADTMQGIIYDDAGDASAILLKNDLEAAKQELIGDVASGKLGLFLMLYGTDDAEDINKTLAEASDWVAIYEAA